MNRWRWTLWCIALFLGWLIGGYLRLETVMPRTGWQERTFPLGCSLQLPANWRWEVQYLAGEELTAQVVLLNQQGAVAGYLQVWNIQDIEEFLIRSRDHSQALFTTYRQAPWDDASVQGLRLSYQQKSGEGLLATEENWLWLKGTKTRRWRVALFNQGDRGNDWTTMAKTILESVKINQDQKH